MVPYRTLVAAGLYLAISTAAASAADPIAYGKHLAGECTSCHKADGQDKGIPSITGWDVAEFVETMKYYQSGSRPNPAMQSVAQSLDDDQMQALAAYFATLPKPPKAAATKN
ncbi:MAG: c-type cytochrome [Hyphomicrobiaceae bacterium]|nr:hypothetical protein [Hyphomicrobiaceae bacterium]